jgi:2-succinyl-5-enolpyruvyl-6-hydroxy-3-cyclohexene-1-carboxylate synthase
VLALAHAVDSHARGALVAGWGAEVSAEAAARFAKAAAWPILADAISGLRGGRSTISTYDPLARAGKLPAPDIVVQVGAPLTGRPARAWLQRAQRHILVDPCGEWLDPDRTATDRLVAHADALLRDAVDHVCWRAPDGEWLDRWRSAEARARATIDELLDAWETPFEGRVVRDVAACLPNGSTVVVGSSMPVRDAESFVAPRDGLRWLSNRGANGIDGFVSTILGVALGAPGEGAVVGLLGDLTLLHDAGGLLHAAERGLKATLVVLDNDGGGIFSFLPQAQLPEHFEAVFGTAHGLDLAAVAAAYGVPAVRVEKAAEVVPAVRDAISEGGVRIIVVPTDRAENVRRHREVWDALM